MLMRRGLTLLALMTGLHCFGAVITTQVLANGSSSALLPQKQLNSAILEDKQIWGSPGRPGDKWSLIRAVSHSLNYLKTPGAKEDYANYAIPGMTRDRIQRSLRRFKTLLKTASNSEALQTALEQEFIAYPAAGNDGIGTVHFTSYFEPEYKASRQRTAQYRYPLYRKPKNFNSWPTPHPSRADLEGIDGLAASKSPLSGQELVWLKDRLEAYLIQVQGTAKLQLTNGNVMTVGYAGSTDHPYTSIGKELIKDGVFTPEELSLPVLIDYLRQNPSALSQYLPRNDRFIFFQETHGKPATGSLGVPVTAERSIATDKSLMPPGALVLIRTRIPFVQPNGELEMRLVSRYVLDQDTGSAIKGPGRVDIFMGTGKVAGDRAGLVSHTGQMYYLLLKE